MPLAIRPLCTAADAAAFRALNQEWSARHFAIEEQDAASSPTCPRFITLV